MLFDISSATVKKLVIHKVGNRSREEGVSLSTQESTADDSVKSILLRNYLGATLKENSIYNFHHSTDIKFNEVYNYSSEALISEAGFIDSSSKIAKHLYASTLHPNVAAGDLFVVLFEGIKYDQRIGNALGIFKTETKESYLNIEEGPSTIAIHKLEGINPNKLQKGAIVFNGIPEIMVVDRLAGTSRYWLETFLNVRPTANSDRAAAIVRSVFKNTIGALSDPDICNKYRSEFVTAAESDAPIIISDLVTITSKYLGEDSALVVARNAAADLGLEYSPQLEVEKRSLNRSLKPYTRKLRIADGLELLVSNGVNLKSIKKKHQNGSTTLSIDIQLEEN